MTNYACFPNNEKYERSLFARAATSINTWNPNGFLLHTQQLSEKMRKIDFTLYQSIIREFIIFETHISIQIWELSPISEII
jgi:hypothetical protein